MIWSTVIFLITISLLVTVHEFGHFIIARLCGVHVECFSVGFGKKLWTHTSKKGTECAISSIPLGGYVKMLDGRNATLTESEKKFAFDHKSVSKRAAIVSAGPIANFILAAIIYWVIFQLGVVTYPVKIEQTISNTPAASVNISSGAELKSIAGIKVESWSDVNSAILSKMGEKTIDITYQLDDGSTYNKSINIDNWRFDIEKESPISALGLIPAPLEIKPVISNIVPGSAAEKAGIKVGDEILSFNGILYDNWEHFSGVIKKAEPIVLKIQRAQQKFFIDLVPDRQLNSQGEAISVAGIYPSVNTTIKQYGIVSALVKSVEQTGLTIKLVVRSFYQLITGVISIKNLSGPVTIAKGAGQTASYGVVPYLYFLAFISISLGVINLVPLPMLDGGHLLFLLIEKIKGSPVSNTKQELFYRLGFIFLIVIMSIALFNDFTRLTL